MPDLIREPRDWRGADGEPSDGPLYLQQVGPTRPGDRPGWVSVTGWRYLPGESAPVRMNVIVRAIPR